MWLKFTAAGEKIYYFPEPIVKFRRHLGSISSTSLIKRRLDYFKDNIKVMQEYIFPNLHLLRMVDIYSIVSRYKYISKLIEKGGDIKAHKRARLYKLLDPFWWADLWHWPIDKIKSIYYMRLLKS